MEVAIGYLDKKNHSKITFSVSFIIKGAVPNLQKHILRFHGTYTQENNMVQKSLLLNHKHNIKDTQ